jgi:RimJ/RimL family protein N-acetyltransferase
MTLAPLHTERLVLRELDPEEPGDRAFMLRLVNDPGFVRHIADLGISDEDGAADYVRRACVHFYRNHAFGMFAVVAAATDEPIGIMGLLKRELLPAPDLGFAFLESHTRKGYGLEAGRAALADAQQRLGIERVLAITGEDNPASIGLLERLGFHRGGPVRLSPEADEALLFSRTSGS